MALAPMLLHVPVSELIQHFWIAERGGDVLDGLAGLLGVAVGRWPAVRVDTEDEPAKEG